MFVVFVEVYLNIVVMVLGVVYVGGDCDSDVEFEFVFDLMFDGFSVYLVK